MQYKITFLDFWHLGSGAGAGAALDATVVKDEAGLPYVPGKTLKGLLREMAEVIDRDKAAEIFGEEGDAPALCYVGNATLQEGTRKKLKDNSALVSHLYDKLTSTRLQEGIAVDKTLRQIEVVVPITLYGEIKTVEEDDRLIAEAMGMIKQMGLGRHRGLGRCIISEVK